MEPESRTAEGYENQPYRTLQIRDSEKYQNEDKSLLNDIFPTFSSRIRYLFILQQLKNTLRLLRFPFSLFLLPVTLFALFYVEVKSDVHTWLVLVIWHLLVFPASNGYNSYNDRDEGPIGGLATPPPPTRQLLYLVNTMDATALLLSLFVSFPFTFFVAAYILASRFYSNRAIRLKKFPIVSFLDVFIFQGAWVFCADLKALSPAHVFSNPAVIYSAAACSFFIGTVYPLTQIYQHSADREDGITTLSMLLGIRGTFIFSALLFIIATLFVYASFSGALNRFWLFNLVMLPSTLYFLTWAFGSFRDAARVNFRNAMGMLVLSSLLNNVFFLILLLN